MLNVLPAIRLANNNSQSRKVETAVLAELCHRVAPEPVRAWAANTPSWLEVLSPRSELMLPELDRAVRVVAVLSGPR